MAMTRASASKSRRINLRATDRQEKLIRTGAQTTGSSVTDFILESACLQAEHILAERREFEASPKQWKAFLEVLDRPAHVIPDLARLFSETPLKSLKRRTQSRNRRAMS